MAYSNSGIILKNKSMVEISNVKVYELWESIIACRNAMRTDLAGKEAPTIWDSRYVSDQSKDVAELRWGKIEVEESLKRAISLSKSPSNSGHPNFLTGIRVAFDIKYPNYFSPELQRYHFIDIVTSSSKMHKLMAMDFSKSCNKYVTQKSIEQMEELRDIYNRFVEIGDKEAIYISFMTLLSNCPLGVELFMRVDTNYMQLRNLYHQRKNHKLKEDWGAFCDMIRSLPYFDEFIDK